MSSSSSLPCALQNFEKPDEDEVAQTAKETEAALLAVVTTKLHAQQPKQLPKQPGDAQYIKYTPAQQGKQYNSGAGQRIIKMQDMPVDPMEPPKFRCTALGCGGFAVTGAVWCCVWCCVCWREQVALGILLQGRVCQRLRKLHCSAMGCVGYVLARHRRRRRSRRCWTCWRSGASQAQASCTTLYRAG